MDPERHRAGWRRPSGRGRLRTSHCDGVQYRLACYKPWNATLLLTVQNGSEFRTGCTEERTLAVIGINRGSARRLSRLLGYEWCA